MPTQWLDASWLELRTFRMSRRIPCYQRFAGSSSGLY
ncbi:hypothetical protein CBM2633_A20002 [Cupriavidus taiwanensis]|uniref:Uncharacterized protein n=1 Tax=Cupriavidus taiwanensis TaxID=164546 RepID=A0A375E5S9_9BURK|nr:hypothetical protein CBM2604_A30089 [Cupriavidus taiwanensis]SOZ26664.1 hypothetical protein CBM2609_A40009 [Cupriavidus taiwanensis]SOZ45387.1 hypothetical protein CBM2610_A50002 [Cupriavidus taiwanensis]SOZ58886.1 hypothetical protein CBM2615_A40002 [Cupriavidus taiwanensis]SOZ59791.1 hypothetical protein CBM2614_A40002 [Cupriavidus taiwanensis]